MVAGRRTNRVRRDLREPWGFKYHRWFGIAKRCLPAGLDSFGVDIVWRYMPVWLLRLLSQEVNGYFQLRTPGHGDVVIDAGAWKGHITVVAARLVGRRGTVVAIEPQEVMCQRLQHRLARLRLKNVIVVNSALYDSASEISVVATHDEDFTVFNRSPGGGERVTLQTLDSILETLGVRQVDF